MTAQNLREGLMFFAARTLCVVSTLFVMAEMRKWRSLGDATRLWR